MLSLTVLFSVIVICHGADIDWTVTVQTTYINDAGTNARIFIQLIGEKGISSKVELDTMFDDFKQGAWDRFYVKLADVGRPTALRVFSDNKGASPDWHFRWIELDTLTAYTELFRFNCGCWMSEDSKLERTLPLATTKWRAKVTTSNLADAGTGTQVWITIVGNLGSTQNIELDNEQSFILRGTTDVLYFRTADVGIPKVLVVRTDDDANDWHLDKIVLEDLDGAATYTFKCNCWLGRKGKTADYIKVS